MYCPNCGSQLIDDTDTCPYCGSKLDVKPNTTTTNNSNNQTNNSNKTDGLSITGFILSFFAPLVALIISIIAYSKAKKDKTSTGFAVAGIIISVVTLVFEIAIFFISFFIQVGAYTSFFDSFVDFMENLYDISITL